MKKEKLDVYGTVCHVSKTDDRKRLFDEIIQQYGKLDILVSNAAISPSFGSVLEVGIVTSCLGNVFIRFRQRNQPGIKSLM